MSRSLEDFADDQHVARFEENASIARTNRTLRSKLRAAEEELAEVKKRLDIYDTVDATRLAPPKWLAPPSRKRDKHLAIPSLMITDVHWGEVVHPEEIGGVNCYNVDIAGQRIERGATGAIKVCRDYLAGLDYEGCNLILGGDNISGEIHEELSETNAEAITESILGVTEAEIALVRTLADFFGNVHIEAVVGNHGRTTKKPRAKRKAKNNWDWLVYRLIAREFASDPRVTINVGKATDCHFAVYGTRYVLSHGDQFRGGSGIAGALSPLLLGVHRKRRRDQLSSKPWDVMIVGHFHQSYFLRDMIVGGSVVGYNEYAYNGNFTPEPATAALWLNTPERGVTAYYPVHLEDRKAEGW